jgi:FG-GAP-like repeat/FG-GAP repeat
MRTRWRGNAPRLVGVVVALAGSACIESKNYTPLPPATLIPTVPQPRLPQNGAYEGSTVLGRLRPRFAWEPSTVEGEGTLRYELQYSADATFSESVTTAMTAQPNHQPDVALAVSTTPPVGRRYYWRVRACAAESCSDYSRPWMVNLGRSLKDFNGDGYDDIVVSWHRNADNGVGAGRANIYYGGPGETFDSTPNGSVADSVEGDWFSSTLSAAGDFNGDGFGDVLVGAQNSDRGGADSGAAYLYFGGAGPVFNAQADVVFVGEAAGMYFSSSLAGGGDLNADGFADVVVGSYADAGGASNVGCIYVFMGSDGAGGGRVAQPASKICGTATDQRFGFRVSEVGDLNGDGFGDVSVMSNFVQQQGQTRKCAVTNFHGQPGDILESSPDSFFAGEPNDECSLTVAAAGDVNQDGYSDAIGVAGESGTNARLFLGGAIVDSGVDMVFNADPAGNTRRASAAGDINGDGIDDVMFSARATYDFRFYVYLGRGSASGLPLTSTPAMTLSGPLGGSFAYSIAAAGDLNGDGYDDVLIGDPTDNNITGRADLYFGNSGASIDTTMNGFITSGQPMTNFGLEVADHSEKTSRRRNAARRIVRRY